MSRMRPFRRNVFLFLSALCVLMLMPLAATADPPYEANLQFVEPVGEAPESMHDCNDAGNIMLNCGFETDPATLLPITDWNGTDYASPFLAIQTGGPGLSPGFGLFSSDPTEGQLALLMGFDADGPDVAEVSQDISIPANSSATLEFDYRAGWDTTFGATLDRTFEVQVQPSGGGAPLSTELILTAPADDQTFDTGPLSATVDLSDYSGESVRVVFAWNVPESFTGPAFFQLDNVLLTSEINVTIVDIPTLSSIGAAALILVLAAASLFVLRRRSSAADG